MSQQILRPFSIPHNNLERNGLQAIVFGVAVWAAVGGVA